MTDIITPLAAFIEADEAYRDTLRRYNDGDLSIGKFHQAAEHYACIASQLPLTEILAGYNAMRATLEMLGSTYEKKLPNAYIPVGEIWRLVEEALSTTEDLSKLKE